MRRLTERIFPKRLDRLGYIWRVLATDVALVFFAQEALVGYPPPTKQLFATLGFIVLAAYQFLFVLWPRVRDTGMSAWCVSLSLIPFVYIFVTLFLAFRPAETHSPRFA